MAKDYGPFPAGLRQGREEGKREILDKLQDLIGHKSILSHVERGLIVQFIKDNSPPEIPQTLAEIPERTCRTHPEETYSPDTECPACVAVGDGDNHERDERSDTPPAKGGE